MRQLAERWSELLVKVGEHNFADVSYRHVIERWQNAVAQVAAVPPDVDPNSVYAHNTDFWEALITISIQIATTSEAPSRMELVKQAVQKAAQELPQRLRNFWDDILSHPLVSLGIGAGSVVFLYLLTRPRRSNTETQS